MSLKNLLHSKVVSCNPETPIFEVARMMDDKNVGAVLIIEKEKPLGIVTDRDIVIRCVTEGEDCKHDNVSEIMTSPVISINVDSGIYQVVQMMKKNKIRRVPVVDGSGKAIGLLSFGDMFQLLREELSHLAEPTMPEEIKVTGRAA